MNKAARAAALCTTLNHTAPPPSTYHLGQPTPPRTVDENYETTNLLQLAESLMNFDAKTSRAMLDLCKVVRNKLLRGRVE